MHLTAKGVTMHIFSLSKLSALLSQWPYTMAWYSLSRIKLFRSVARSRCKANSFDVDWFNTCERMLWWLLNWIGMDQSVVEPSISSQKMLMMMMENFTDKIHWLDPIAYKVFSDRRNVDFKIPSFYRNFESKKKATSHIASKHTCLLACFIQYIVTDHYGRLMGNVKWKLKCIWNLIYSAISMASQRLMGCGVCSSFIHFSSARLPCCPYERVFALMLEHKLKSFSNKQTPR